MRTKLLISLSILLYSILFVTSVSFAAPPQMKPAVVKNVIDSFTFEVISDKKTEQVRLLDLLPMQEIQPADLPKYEETAVDRDLKQLIGKTVYLEFDNQLRDNNNRLLAYIWLKKPQTGDVDEMTKQMLNARLLLYGYAEWYPLNPNYKYISELLSMETNAYFANRGIWGQ